MPVVGFCKFIIAQEERCLPMLREGPEINFSVIINLLHKYPRRTLGKVSKNITWWETGGKNVTVFRGYFTNKGLKKPLSCRTMGGGGGGVDLKISTN
jgi:hypothetical protein